MSSNFLALDIKNDLLTAIAFTVDAKAMQITDSVLLAVSSRPLEEALADLAQKIDIHNCSCHVALEPESFLYRNLSLPFTDSRTISKILPLELEENTPIKIDRLLIDAMIAKGEDQKSQVIAAMIDRELLASRLAALRTVGIDPETVTISGIPTALRLSHIPDLPANFLLLDIGLQHATFILIRSGHISLIRPLVFDPGIQCGFQFEQENNAIKVFRPENIENTFGALCIAIQQTLQSVFYPQELAIYLSGPVGSLEETAERIQSGLGTICRSCTRAVDSDPSWQLLPQLKTAMDGKWPAGMMEDSVNLGWQVMKNWKGFNFRKEAFSTKKSFTNRRTLTLAIVLPLASLALLSILYLWYDYTRLLKEKNGLDTQIRAVFSETLPDITRVVDPLQQLQVKIRETRQTTMDKDGTLPATTILDLLTTISASIPETLDIRLARFVVDDTGLRLKGTTDTFNTVDAIKKRLEQSPVFSSVEISVANLDPKSSKIRFELKLTMKGT